MGYIKGLKKDCCPDCKPAICDPCSDWTLDGHCGPTEYPTDPASFPAGVIASGNHVEASGLNCTTTNDCAEGGGSLTGCDWLLDISKIYGPFSEDMDVSIDGTASVFRGNAVANACGFGPPGSARVVVSATNLTSYSGDFVLQVNSGTGQSASDTIAITGILPAGLTMLITLTLDDAQRGSDACGTTDAEIDVSVTPSAP